MEEKKNKKNIFIFFLKMLFIFLIIDVIMMLFAGGLVESTLFNKYGKELITEIFYAFSILIVMLLFKNSYVFTQNKDKFFTGIKLAIPMILFSIINLFSSLFSIESFSLGNFINVLIFCIFIGIAEEFLCRGWIQNEFIERFSNGKKEVLASIVLASLVFGFMHIMNLSVQTPFETILQIINATALGFLLGSIYYKTKNIWSVIFLHSFYDFSLFLSNIDVVKDCSYSNPSVSFIIVESISVIILSALWVLGSIYVLNNSDLFDNKKYNNTIIIATVILLVLYLMPYHRLVSDYDKYIVCYNYKSTESFKEYTLSFPNYEKYTIEDEEYSYNVYEKDNKIVVENNNTGFKKSFIITNIVSFEVIENENGYDLVIYTSSDEATIYYTNHFIKGQMSNDNDYIKKIKFNKFVLPEIDNIGYISAEEKCYPYFISTNNDRFVIMDKEIYIIK